MSASASELRANRRIVNLKQMDFGLWSILEAPFLTLVNQVGPIVTSQARNPLLDDDDDDDDDDDRPYYAVVNGVAVLEAVGPLTKYSAWYYGGTSSVTLRRCVRSCLTDSRVKAVLLLVDSPGGTVSGTKDLADDLAELSLSKPCYAYIQDLGCSAAYWLASSCTKIFANSTALVGSIGTYMAVADFSGLYEAAGVKVHLVKAGEFKGAGTQGTPITESQLAQWQTLIDDVNGQFIRATAQGRKMALKTMRDLADGRAYPAGAAEKNGLIDGVQTLDETLAMLGKARAPRTRASEANGLFKIEMRVEGVDWKVVAQEIAEENLAVKLAEFETQALSTSGAAGPAGPDAIGSDPQTPGATQEISTMADTTTATKIANPAGAVALEPGTLLRATLGSTAATLGELEAACQGADEKFLLAQLRGNVTVDAARANWTAELKNRLDAKQAELTAAIAKAAGAKKPGVDPLLDTTTGADAELHGDPIAAWEKLQAEAFAKNKDKAAAMRELVAEHGDAHDAYVTAYNGQNPFKRRR